MFISKTILTRVTAAATLAAALLTSSMASAYQRWVDISNAGSSEIVSVRISDIDRNAWGPNLLDYTISVGDTATVDPLRTRGYCRFNILVDFANGDELTIWDVNLCEATDVVTNEWTADIYYS